MICPECESRKIKVEGFFIGYVRFDENLRPVFDIYCVESRLLKCAECGAIIVDDDIHEILTEHLTTAFTICPSKALPSSRDVEEVKKRLSKKANQFRNSIRRKLSRTGGK